MALYQMPQLVPITVRGVCRNRTRTDIQAGRHRIVIDEPPARHGGDEGMLPLQALMAAFASCTHVVANVIATEMAIDFADEEVEVAGTLDTRGFTGAAAVKPPFPAIAITVSYRSSAGPSEVAELRQQLSWRCPVQAQLRAAGTRITETWNRLGDR